MLNLLWILLSVTSFAQSYDYRASGSGSMPPAGVYENKDGYPLIPAIQNAQQSIDIEIYTMKDLMVRQEIRNALARRVQVRIVKEPRPVGEHCNVFAAQDSTQATGEPSTDSGASDADCADQQQLVQDVQAAGGIYEPFNRKGLCPREKPSCLEHGKIAIIDQQTALISTGNFDATSLCISSEKNSKCNRDYTVVVDETRIVSTLENLFSLDVKGEAYDVKSVIPADLADRLTVSPFSMDPIVNLIKSAQSSVSIEAQYLKDGTLNNALVDAAKRGVTVKVLVASFCAFGSVKEYEAEKAKAIYSDFDRAGIQSRVFNSANKIDGHAGYMHAKVIVIDGQRAWLGSVNGSTQSLTQNREYGITVDQNGWVKEAADDVDSDFSDPNTETWQESLDCVKDHGHFSADDSSES